MIRKLARSIREYKKYAILTLIFMVLEASIECAIPFITASLVNKIKAGAEVVEICKIGIVLVIMAMCSLACGGGGGYTCSKASAGFAKNLRSDVFRKIQDFTFTNIDKFSSTSLVTRMTTDVTYVQMSFMMIIRTAIRSPLMFIFSIIMAYIMGGVLSLAFVIIIPVLIIGLIIIAKKAMPAFKKVFKRYDNLNESIEENVRGMRVVKGFSREEYEKEKFGIASESIKEDFTKADKIIAFNAPIMQFCLYFNMIFVLFVGAMISIKSGGTTIDVGELTAMLNYAMQILMALMMLSMIYVMITMSA
jgi:ATP-binding cassette subfamily B protein